MKKILVLSIALIAVIALTAGGTWAYFNDVVKSEGNTITAGTLFLTVGGTTGTGHFAIGTDGQLKPGSHGHAGNYAITTNGTIKGDLYAKAVNLVNDENGTNPAEIKAGDDNPDVNGGELGGLLQIAIWVDKNGNGTYQSGIDYYINSTGGVSNGGTAGSIDGNLPDAAYTAANTLVGAFIGSTALDSDLSIGTYGSVYVEYNFPTTSGDHFAVNTDNITQGDDVKFDLQFALVQHGS
jgi:predicted ribosomally synthesized peptide with SipW-like signal peptide